jgi:hypothetical protein
VTFADSGLLPHEEQPENVYDAIEAFCAAEPPTPGIQLATSNGEATKPNGELAPNPPLATPPIDPAAEQSAQSTASGAQSTVPSLASTAASAAESIRPN